MDRALFLSRLEAELRQAEWCAEQQRADQLRGQITRASAGTAVSPAMETTGRPAARRRTSGHRASR